MNKVETDESFEVGESTLKQASPVPMPSTEQTTQPITDKQANINIQEAVDIIIKKTRKRTKKLELTKSIFSTTERNDGWIIETNQKRFIKKLQRFGVPMKPIENSKGAVTAIVPYKWISIRKSRVGMSPGATAMINKRREMKNAAKASSRPVQSST